RLGDLFQRITNWLVIREGDPLERGSQVPQFTTRLRQLRTMLHLVDADGPHVDPRKDVVRQRRLLTQRVLLNRVRLDPKGSLRRTLCAATARTCDALVREEIADISDIVIAAAGNVSHLDDLKTMAEASMVPEIECALRAYGKLLQATRTVQRDGHGLVAAADALKAIGNELPVARSARIEALRQALSLLARGLRSVGASNSLGEIAERSSGTPLAMLERGVASLAQLVSGSRRRLGSSPGDESPTSAAAIWASARSTEIYPVHSASSPEHCSSICVRFRLMARDGRRASRRWRSRSMRRYLRGHPPAESSVGSISSEPSGRVRSVPCSWRVAWKSGRTHQPRSSP
ncbi:MAG: hypothetical protein JRF54_15650, partial [Deltaproteobacteria bacterium]|nr:hypothetical protein [Deltaproteobacteria bacterium]